MKKTISLLTLVTLALASGCAFQTGTETTTPKCEKSAPKTAVVAATTQTDADILKRDVAALELGSWALVASGAKDFSTIFSNEDKLNGSVRVFFIGNQILFLFEDYYKVFFAGTYTLRIGKEANEIVIKDSLGKRPDIVGVYRIKADGKNFSLSFPSLQKPDSNTPLTFLFFRK